MRIGRGHLVEIGDLRQNDTSDLDFSIKSAIASGEHILGVGYLDRQKLEIVFAAQRASIKQHANASSDQSNKIKQTIACGCSI